MTPSPAQPVKFNKERVMTQEINDFSRRILDKILASAQQHDVAIIGIVDDQTTEARRQTDLLRAFLERRRYGVKVLTLHWPSPQTHFVVSNIGRQDDFRLTLARLGRHFGARWVLIIPEGGEGIHTLRTDERRYGWVKPIENGRIIQYFCRINKSSRPPDVASLAEVMPIMDGIGTSMGKLGLDASLRGLEKTLAKIEAPPERPGQSPSHHLQGEQASLHEAA
ncbi:hypothetical protein CK625_09525 [Vandammella animalimorsus]|uniref:Uncharacterized protein n=2 Tax=Vandammella animalimorsus TaxID=2029117 RepID=A0A2A2AG03_9BURK|nr:hypothetical protein CK625_09525 [Vandammella animalimorsus]